MWDYDKRNPTYGSKPLDNPHCYICRNSYNNNNCQDFCHFTHLDLLFPWC